MPESISPVRIGIVGCGNVLGAYLAVTERLRQKGWAAVTTLCAGEKHRRRARDDFHVPNFETEYSALLARPDVDAIVILTPMSQHGAMAKAALGAGKHVLVEKPMAVSLAEAAELVALAATAPGYLVCAPFTTLSPTFQ